MFGGIRRSGSGRSDTTEWASGLAHEAGLQTESDPVDLAGNLVILIDETNGFGFRPAFENPGGTAQRKILDQDHTVAVAQHGAMGILDHSGPVGNLGLGLAFPLMAAGEAFPLAWVFHPVGHFAHRAGGLAHERLILFLPKLGRKSEATVS